MEIKKGQYYKHKISNEVLRVTEVRNRKVFFSNDVYVSLDRFHEFWELIEESNEKPKQYNIGIDTFKRCEANMTREEILVCCKFNIDKYNWRTKGQDKEDLEKIINYAKWALEQF